MLMEQMTVNEKGMLEFAGRPCDELAEKYGTPLYVMDEELIRNRMRLYQKTMKKEFGEDAEVLFASKACDFKAMYRIAKEEKIGVDVVSDGEIFTAFAAGYPMERLFFHGNNKTDDEIRFAMEKQVGTFVIDSEEELDAVEKIAAEKNRVQRIVIRVTPGIDPHTFEAVATGLVDSKFGAAIETGAAMALVKKALHCFHVSLQGFHCHVGSQVFDEEVFVKSADAMFSFAKDVQDKLGFECKEMNLGGGIGVRYVEKDPQLQIEQTMTKLAKHVKELCGLLKMKLPAMRLEPGRSIVADAGMTLYQVGNVKKIPQIKTYVSVNGGMTDNPRYALYRSSYSVVCANRMNEKNQMLCSVVGKCCESGDILQEHVLLPETVQRNDLIAVLTTGAYNYSMASNYNRIVRPAVLMIHKEGEYLAVQRETFEDLIKNEF